MKRAIEKAAKAAAGTGRAIGAFVGLIKWFLIAVTAVALAFAGYIAYDGTRNVWQVVSSFVSTVTGQDTPKTPEEQKVEERRIMDGDNFYCATLGGADNGRTPEERGIGAITIYNLAAASGVRYEKEENGRKVVEVILDTCDVIKKFRELQVPGDPDFTSWRWNWLTRIPNDKAKISQAATMLRQYITDPKPLIAKWPDLPKSTKQIRMTWLDSPPILNRDGMRATMCRWYGIPGVTAEFFRTRTGPDDKCN